MITAANYQKDKISKLYVPGRYPGKNNDEWVLPEEIRTDYAKLNSIIETNYTREYLKICAFYNKILPTLRSGGYVTSSYNVPSFTTMDQERTDTGTGMSSNYLKQIVDQVVSRIGTVTFEPTLVADVPTLEYIVYKDEVERLMRKAIRNEKINRMCMEVFHDAAVVCFSHVFIDPITHKPVKANDYEVGMFESQFTSDDVKQMLYRNYKFPTTSLAPYLAREDDALKQTLLDEIDNKDSVDFKMYFDCPEKRVIITINGKTLKEVNYPFDTVQMVTFGWDIGFSKVTASSLFDLLYPTQRELNKVNAKIQQLIRMYKGAVPVFNNDVDLAMKSISNGSGEALYVDSSRPIDSLMTVINPTPIDAQLSATKTELKTEMYELAGLQQVSFNMENMRSAAAVIAIDQTRDTVFQAQLDGISRFVSQLFRTIVNYNAEVFKDEDSSMSWADVKKLVDEAEVDLKPVTITSPLGNKNEALKEEPDYKQMSVARTITRVIKNEVSWDTVSFAVDKMSLKMMAAITIVKFEALGIEVPDSLQRFIISAFIEDIQLGLVSLVGDDSGRISEL